MVCGSHDYSQRRPGVLWTKLDQRDCHWRLRNQSQDHLGHLLELHSLEGVQPLARENIIQTYLVLAAKVPGVRQESSPDRVLSHGPEAVSFTSFAGRLNWPSQAEAEKGLAELAELHPSPSLFVVEGDSSCLTEKFLFDHGWMIKYELSQMAWMGKACDCDLSLAESVHPRDRAETSAFMTDQFFTHGSHELRQAIVSATALAPVHLFSYAPTREIEGAVMLSLTEGCMGLYNLCVHSSKRGKGVGKGIVRWVQLQALARGQAVVLQCSQDLVRFYRECGFTVSGRMECWGRIPDHII